MQVPELVVVQVRESLARAAGGSEKAVADVLPGAAPAPEEFVAVPATLLTWLEGAWEQTLTIWLDGGWAMIAIAVLAFVMFSMGVLVHVKLRRLGFAAVPEEAWRAWIDRPDEREGPIGKLLDRVTGARNLQESSHLFEQLRATEAAPFDRDLRVMKVCVSAAPLVGLLGTVTGMLSTFGALAAGSGGDKTMELVAAGISEALITTETGLVIALPGLFFQYQLARRFETYKAFLAHLESVCAQALYRRMGRRRKGSAARSARTELARRIVDRLRAGAAAAGGPAEPGPSARALTTANEH